MKAWNTKYVAMAVVALAAVQPASAQYWEEAGMPTRTPGPTVCYTDTVHDWLLVAGQGWLYLDSMHAYMPLYRYNGVEWDTLGLFGNKVRTAVVYRDTLIVAGGFGFMQDTAIAHIAYYAEGTWHPYGTFGDQWGSGTVQQLRVIDGELYAVGIFKNADGQLCNGLAKRVGGHWEPLPGWTEMGFIGEPWLHDIVRFQGKLVVGGNFSVSDLVRKDLLQYDGSAWVPVCDGCLHGGLDGVGGMAEYQGSLYVGGIFYHSSGNAGQSIMRWDGEDWYSVGPVGGGIQLDNYSDQYAPDLSWLQVHDGLLYIGGVFGFVEHVASPAGIVTWDGYDFCMLQGDPFSIAYAPFDFYHDTLYGGTIPEGIQDTSLLGVVRYLGELCTFTGVEEVPAAADALQVAWSPTGELALLGLADGPHTLRAYDAQGRVVLDQTVSSTAGRSETVRLADSSTLFLIQVDGVGAVKCMGLR
ncbi:MAG: hypothetical protein KBH07_06765 [Flavobacteriales bacterium]|nr:hypothetical protein [Flavobacteriales bacterium]MBP9079826.1 hypothetical protein [Flavobacteriales bacterium]